MENTRPHDESQKKESTPPTQPDQTGGVSFIQPPQQEEGGRDQNPGVNEVREELLRSGVSTTPAPSDPFVKTAKTILRPLRTYKDDIAAILKKTKGSKVSIQAAEAKRQERLLKEAKERAKEAEAARQREQELAREAQQNELAGEKAKAEREQQKQKELAEVEAQEFARQKTLAEQAQQERQTLEQAQVQQAQELDAQAKQQKQRWTERQQKLVAEQKIADEQARIQAEQEKLQQTQALLQQEATERPQPTAPQNKRKLPLLLISMLFLVLGAGALYGAYLFFFTEDTPRVNLGFDTLILAEESIEVDITTLSGEDLVGTLAREKNNLSTPGDVIVHIKPVETSAAAGDERVVREFAGSFFFERLAPNAPTALARSFGDAYMLGVFVSGQAQPFLIMKPTFYENAFAAMLAWEKTMRGDLSPLFRNEAASAFDSNVSPADFEDKVIANKDTRVLYNDAGDVILLYSFTSRDTLVITTGEAAFLEILKRINAKRVSS